MTTVLPVMRYSDIDEVIERATTRTLA